MEEYSVPDEHLSYSELKDRVRIECARVLPKKERILLMAKRLEEDLTIKDTICNQICTDLGDVTSERWIRKCLPDEYKQQRKRRDIEESSDLRNSAANIGKKVPEQKAMTVDTQGYEETFEDADRGPNVKSAAEQFEMMKKKLADVTYERDTLSIENQVLKEKTQPEMLKEIQERFYDEPDLIKGDRLQKVNETAGKNLIRLLERYNSILNDSAKCGQPIPVGLYVIAKPEMVFVPVRLTVDYRLKRVDISLWEKKLQSLNN
jgi:hypothetical protein